MIAAKLPRLETVEIVEEPIPEPKKGEVLVRMKASALCRSDLHRYHGTQIFEGDDEAAYITPGHEPCGIVEKLGEGVTKVKKGDRVAIYLGLGCGTCPDCLRGDVMLCKKFRCIGFAVNGAHADYMTIPEENCLPMPDKMDYITGALSTDVGGTLYTGDSTQAGTHRTIAGRLTTPGRAKDIGQSVVHDSNDRIIIVHQLAVLDMFQPERGMGALAGTALAKEKEAFPVLDRHGCVHLEGVQTRSAECIHEHQGIIDAETFVLLYHKAA